MPNHARATGAALEAHYRFILWLVPTVKKPDPNADDSAFLNAG